MSTNMRRKGWVTPGIKPNQDHIERQIAVDAGLARTASGRKFLAKRGAPKANMQEKAQAQFDDYEDPTVE